MFLLNNRDRILKYKDEVILCNPELIAKVAEMAGCTVEEIENQGFADYYVDHAVGIWPQSAGGIPFNSCEFQSKGDPITDMFESMAAEGAIV